jgi:hypothetical protein
MRTLALILIASAFAAGAAEPPKKGAAKGERKLWAAISINQPIFEQGQLDKLQLYVGVVNDGDRPVDPKLESSQLFVNGKALKDWQYTMSNGIRDNRFNRLPPGDYLCPAPGIGRYFKTPGIYKVILKGDGYASNEIVFRVLAN